jgi:hypothetical protein
MPRRQNRFHRLYFSFLPYTCHPLAKEKVVQDYRTTLIFSISM